MDIILLTAGIAALFFNSTSTSIVIMFALLTSYFQLGSNLSEVIVNHSVSDCGLILFFIIWLYNYIRRKPGRTKDFTELKNSIFVFACFLSVAILFDLALRGTGIVSEIQTYRHWLLLILAVPFASYMEISALKKAITGIFCLSVIATIIILADTFLSLDLLNKDTLEYMDEDGTIYARGAIPTTFCTFYLLLSITRYGDISSKYRYLSFFLFFLSIISSMIRSMFISSLIGVLMVLFFVNRVKIKGLIRWGLLFIVIFLFVSSSGGFVNRLTEGFRDIISMTEHGASIEESGTFNFRIMLLEERAGYVLSSIDKFLFGIGGIKETDFHPIFKIGLQGAQLDTSDIAWPLLLLRLGYVGTILLLWIWYRMFGLLFKSKSILGMTGWVYMVINILLSFCSSFVANGAFWLFMILVLFVSSYPDVNRCRVTSAG